jgi:hypothetical protein
MIAASELYKMELEIYMAAASELYKMELEIYMCAAEAIFCCPTENSRHLQLVSKDGLFKKEKESARCHVSSEKSSKNYIRCESEPSQAAIHSVPPPHLSAKKRVARADFPRGEGKCASWRRRGNLEGGGQGDLRIDIIR